MHDFTRLQFKWPGKYVSAPEDTPDLPDFSVPGDQPHQEHMTTGMIISIVVNVVLVAALAVGMVSYYRLKRKTEDFCYNIVDNALDDVFLT